MANGHGGARPGAGRKKKDRSKQDFFETAEDYLLAVVQGTTEPDTVRVQAARTLIQYQTARKRAPVKNPSPEQLHKRTESDLEKSNIADFEARAAKIRAKHARGVKK